VKRKSALWAVIAIGCALSACSCGEDPQVVTPPDAGSTPDAGPKPAVPCTGADYARCDGVCVNLAATVAHCGACDNACIEGAVCSFGACGCPAGRTACTDACAELASDARHCGACGNACPLGSACLAGECILQCQAGETRCDDTCANLQTDPARCGSCTNACSGGRVCDLGTCKCLPGQTVCAGQCADTQTDTSHCGGCGTQCFNGYQCKAGACVCPAGYTACGSSCVDTSVDTSNCGGCNLFCAPGQQCVGSVCDSPCPSGYVKCGASCVNPATNPSHCGACGNACGNLSCIGGQCVTCNSATTDCDGDGWLVADGDCCDQPGAACGNDPAMVNPGALELLGNGIDDNCNGLVDGADTLDTTYCDTGLLSNSTDPLDFARAFGVCRTTTETAPLPSRTWGLISAKLVRADGSPIISGDAHSIRGSFGNHLVPNEGRSFVVLSSGAAADAVQTNPGPNGGPSGSSVSHTWFGSGVDIQTCSQPYCISDWFNTGNPPLKLAQRLPEAPGCAGGGFGEHEANDSVMLVLRLRAPTNVRAFQFNGYFLSSEYPEYVCTTFNDQFIALVDTPGGFPIGASNPVDKNLMTYFNNGQRWPVGINVAKGTGLFRVCETQAQNPQCWDPDVSTASCAHGATQLTGTGFDWMNGPTPGPGNCLNGGGTGWLTTSGNLRPGEILELRMAIWDVGDTILDSTAILDGFRWLTTPAAPGTTD
jgi:hypothetical protein